MLLIQLDWLDEPQPSAEHTHRSLVNFSKFETGCSCLKENPSGTSFNPSGSQSRNQGGFNFIISEKQMIENKTDTQF